MRGKKGKYLETSKKRLNVWVLCILKPPIYDGGHVYMLTGIIYIHEYRCHILGAYIVRNFYM